jgi:hypothetical protein
MLGDTTKPTMQEAEIGGSWPEGGLGKKRETLSEM